MKTTEDVTTHRARVDEVGRVLSWAGVALAGVSPLAFVADEKFDLPMRVTVPILVVPAAVALAALAVIASRVGAPVVTRAIAAGLLVGVLATPAYDGLRLAALSMGYASHDEAVGFGERIVSHGGDSMAGDSMSGDHMADETPAATASTGAKLAGYVYHYWNGVSFAVAFLLLLRRRPWLALPYMAVFIYGGMVVVMGTHGLADFVLEVIGHLAFGAILGAAAWLVFTGRRPAPTGSPT